MKINAVSRLRAVTIKQRAYSDAQGLADLDGLQRVFARSRRRIGKDKNGFIFWWVGAGERNLVCTTSKGECVAFIELNPRVQEAYMYPGVVRGRGINVTFTKPEYRGRGLMLGMHQYLTTVTNLISDDVYSPEGLKIWHQLMKLGHKIEVSDGESQDEADWGKHDGRLLIRRGQ